jgi:hypothetical protein
MVRKGQFVLSRERKFCCRRNGRMVSDECTDLHWIECEYDASKSFADPSTELFTSVLKFYFRGVAHPRRAFCNPAGLNHGVLLVGYGVEEKREFDFHSLSIEHLQCPFRFEVDSVLDYQE